MSSARKSNEGGLPSLLISIADGVIDLGWGHPSEALHPLADVRRAAEFVLGGESVAALQYGAVQGFGPLLESLSGFLSNQPAYGMDVPPEQLFLTSGASQGLDMGLHAVHPGGRHRVRRGADLPPGARHLSRPPPGRGGGSHGRPGHEDGRAGGQANQNGKPRIRRRCTSFPRTRIPRAVCCPRSAAAGSFSLRTSTASSCSPTRCTNCCTRRAPASASRRVDRTPRGRVVSIGSFPRYCRRGCARAGCRRTRRSRRASRIPVSP